MNTENLKKEIHTLIDNTEDEELLSMVKEDIIFYQKTNTQVDDLSDLSDEDRAELEEQFKEDPMKDTITYEEHKKNMKEWLLQLSPKKGMKTI